MLTRTAAIVAAMSLALALTACSSAGTGTPSAATSTVPATGTASADSTATSTGSMKGSNPDVAALLTLADVERVTGLTDLKSIAENSVAEADGRLNFATSDGTLALTVNIGDGYAFDDSKAGMFYKSDITGVGEEAYVGPSETISKTLSLVAARTGDHAVVLHTATKAGAPEGSTVISIDQLKEIAKLILSRWQ